MQDGNFIQDHYEHYALYGCLHFGTGCTSLLNVSFKFFIVNFNKDLFFFKCKTLEYHGCSQWTHYIVLASCCPQGTVLVPSFVIKTIDNPQAQATLW